MYPDATCIHATFAQLATEGMDASRIIDMTVSRWLDIHILLSPIIGEPGVVALFERSVRLASDRHPCLAAVHEGAVRGGEFGALHRALARETNADAAAASDALLCTFQELLTKLIGTPLAERLLGSVWSLPPSGHDAQDSP
jgi:hypothetical protein